MTKAAINIKMLAPISMLHLDSSSEMKTLVKTLVGCECIPCQGSNGSSPYGDWEEGDVEYYSIDDQLGYRLSYDYEIVDDGWGMVKSYTLDRCETFDHEFDVNRNTLIRVLKESLESYHLDADTIKAIADKFAIKL